MVRISTSSVWVLCALFVLAVAAAGLGCAEYSCETCDGQVLPEARSVSYYQPARPVATAAVRVSPTQAIALSNDVVRQVPLIFDDGFVQGDITLRI